MKRFIKIICTHKFAVIFALVVGIIIVYPQFIFRFENKYSYQGIDMAFTTDESFYVGRIQEIKDGNLLLGNAVLKDGKEDPYVFPPLGENINALLGKSFNLNTQDTVHLSRFIFSFMAFIIVYALIFFLSKSKSAALSASLIMFLADNLLSYQGIIKLFKEGVLRTDFLPFTRPIHPQISSIFFFGFLLLFLNYYKKKTLPLCVGSIVLLGASFYVYPFVWTFLYAFCGILVLIFLFQKNWQMLKDMLIIAMAGILLAIPYFLNFFKALKHVNYYDFSLRLGIMPTHFPVFGFLVPALFILVLFLFPRRIKENYIFSLGLAIAPLIVLNQQIITGKILGPGHYHFYYNRPLAIMFIVIIIFVWLNKKKLFLFKKVLTISIIILTIYAGFSVQINSYARYEESALNLQKYGPIIKWLKTNCDKNSVVFANILLSDLIVQYTPINVYYNSSANLYLHSSFENLLDSIFLLYRMDGIDADNAKDIFMKTDERKKISNHIYRNYYKEQAGNYEAIPDEALAHFAQKYKNFLSVPIEKILKNGKVNYLISDSIDQPLWNVEEYQFLREIYQKNGIIIYKMLD